MADITPEPASKTSNNGNDIPNPSEKDNTTVEVTTAEQDQIRSNLEEFERLFGVDEESYEQPTTTRKELWSYYLYYNGNSAIGVIIRTSLTYSLRRGQWCWPRVIQSSAVCYILRIPLLISQNFF